MLPKVANQILQHTSRAVTAVQNQTIRNVLQLQSSTGPSAANNLGSWNGPTSSSSGYGGSSTGSGGAKFHSSRFNTNYSVTGRAVTQADPSIASGTRGDESEEIHLSLIEQRPVAGRTRQRLRSSSLSFTIQDQDVAATSDVGVLKAIKHHIRTRHAFAALSDKQHRPASSQKTIKAASVVDESPSAAERTAGRAAERAAERAEQDSFIARIREATADNKIERVLAEIQTIRSSESPLSTDVFNAALHGLYTLRKHGDSLRPIFELYNHMTHVSVVPDVSTYSTLILALTDRDREVHKILNGLERRIQLYGQNTHSGLSLKKRAEHFESEKNFHNALALFQTACLVPRTTFPVWVSNGLLRSCAFHANIDAALHIFSYIEKSAADQIDSLAYRHLLETYSNAGDLAGARQVFDGFLAAAKSGHVDASEPHGHRYRLTTQISVWNCMIGAYIRLGQPAEGLALLEEMMDSPAGVDFGIADVPLPSPFTYTQIINAFCRAGDFTSALGWFDRLLQQPLPCPEDPHMPSLEPTKPDSGAWTCLIQFLSIHGLLAEVRRIANIAQSERLYSLKSADRLVIGHAHVAHLQSLPEATPAYIMEQMELAVPFVRGTSTVVALVNYSAQETFDMYYSIITYHLKAGRPDHALDLAEGLIHPLQSVLQDIHQQPAVIYQLQGIRKAVANISTAIVEASPSSPVWTLSLASRLVRLSLVFQDSPLDIVALHYVTAFSSASPAEKEALNVADWEALFLSTARVCGEVPESVDPLGIFMEGISSGIRVAELPESVVAAITDFVRTRYQPSAWASISAQLGLPFDAPQAAQALPQLSEETVPVTISAKLSRSIDQFGHHNNARITPLEAYGLFEAGAQSSTFPNPIVLGRLINAIGRLGHVDKVKVLYDAAQRVLASMESDKQSQSLGWFQIEDQMIIALAHAGDIDGAHVHRQRVIHLGGCPSADAYGVLIQNVKDTTDDTTNALAFYNEAVSRGVVANTFLYNIIISKLAKARKADDALQIFHEMKGRGMQPTSVTYGALIAACCRVGDVASAENLFSEMSEQSNFKPRIPPYNTMMQLYTQTKPDRARVLHYYDALTAANIRPTAHTYKLLLDAYGTIEPADPAAMEEVFTRLLQDRSVTVNGTHWASLVNAWGCVQKDLDKAISVFESVGDHPSTRQSGTALPDAVTFEALINVFVTLRRPDLIPVYVSKLSDYGIHMTAYIANLLIKGYAMSGNVEQSRAVFESLVDPPEGVAAPNNHAPHNGQHPSQVPTGAPVFREPSTWEAMVRAELGNGNRDEALALLERVKARRFPPAVYSRISGIMLDDSVSPWSSPSNATTPASPAE